MLEFFQLILKETKSFSMGSKDVPGFVFAFKMHDSKQNTSFCWGQWISGSCWHMFNNALLMLRCNFSLVRHEQPLRKKTPQISLVQVTNSQHTHTHNACRLWWWSGFFTLHYHALLGHVAWNWKANRSGWSGMSLVTDHCFRWLESVPYLDHPT